MLEEYGISCWKSAGVELNKNAQGYIRAAIHLEREKTKSISK